MTSQFGAERAVVAIGQRAEILQSFTSDTGSIHAAFDRVRKLPTFYDHHKIDRAILSDRTGRSTEFATPADYAEKVRFSAREQTFRNLITMQNTSRAVTDMARAHSADVGKKYIILLTGGMELNTAFAAYDKGGRDQELEELRRDIAKTIDGMVREANAASFTVHVINGRARAMQAPQHDVENHSSGLNMTDFLHWDGGNEPIDVADVDSIPLSLALGTGGMDLPSNDIVKSVERIEHQTANFYSLGYSPSHQGDRQYHRIRVNVKRRGLRVANRAGYFDLTPEDRLQEMLHARASGERNVGSLPVTISVGTPHPGERDVVVPVTAALSMGRVTLLPRDDGYVGRVHVYLSVFDENGRNIVFQHQTQEVTLHHKTQDLLFTPAQRDQAMTDAFRYRMNLRLDRGEFTIAVTLRDDLSNEVGTAVQKVKL